MSDKSHVQVHLAENLASLVCTLDGDLATVYLESFWKTLVKEWSGIDRIRLDKFYMLMRKFHAAAVRRMIASEWSEECINDVLHTLPLTEQLGVIADSIRYHIIQVFFEEMSNVLDTLSPLSCPPHSALIVLLAPFITELSTTSNKPFSSMIQQEIFMQMTNEEGVPSCFTNLDLGDVAKVLFKVGSESGVTHANRKVLYEVSGTLAEGAGIEVRVETNIADDEITECDDIVIAAYDNQFSMEDLNDLKRKAIGDDEEEKVNEETAAEPTKPPKVLAEKPPKKKSKKSKAVVPVEDVETPSTSTEAIPIILETPANSLPCELTTIAPSKKSKKSKKKVANAVQDIALAPVFKSIPSEASSTEMTETPETSSAPSKSLKNKKKARQQASGTSAVADLSSKIVDTVAESSTQEIASTSTTTNHTVSESSESLLVDVKKSVSWGKNATKTFLKRKSITTLDAVLKEAAADKEEKVLKTVLKKTPPVVFDAIGASTAGPIRSKGKKVKKSAKKTKSSRGGRKTAADYM